jgi:hypothetical protein
MSQDSPSEFPELRALPPGSLSNRPDPSDPDTPIPGWKRSLLSRKSKAIYEAEMRLHILTRKQAGYTFKAIAAELQVSVDTVKRYYRQALDRIIEMEPYQPKPEPQMFRRLTARQAFYKALGPGYKAGRRTRGKARTNPGLGSGAPPGSGPTPGSESVEGEVFVSPEEQLLRENCLLLIKAQQPYPVIARALGITVQEARRYVREELRKLEDAELDAADIERRLMVEQLNQMIAAIHPAATGQVFEQGEFVRRPPVLEAVDRMLKLMKQKADLLGLNQVPMIDIRMQLRLMAEEAGYDYDDVEDIARQVIEKRRLTVSGA